MMVVILVMSLFSMSTFMYNIMTLSAGFAFGGIEILTFVLLSEFIDSRYRNYFIGVLNSSSGFALIFSAILAYEVYDWKYITMTNTAIIALAAIGSYKIDESPRYLASVKGKYRQAK